MNKRITTIVFLLLAVVAGYFGGLTSRTNSQASESVPVTSKVVRAERFELVDSTGKTCGVFGTGMKGEPCLTLLNSTGKTCGVFSTVDDEPNLILYDSVGKVRGVFDIFKGEPNLILYDSASKIRGMLNTVNGVPNFVLCNAAGKPVGLLISPEPTLNDVSAKPESSSLTVLEDDLVPDGRFLNIIGVAQNNSDRTYKSVSIWYNLYDKSGAQVGTASDQIFNFEPHSKWKFKALITSPETVDRYKLKGFGVK
jgi:hypothetical protein